MTRAAFAGIQGEFKNVDLHTGAGGRFVSNFWPQTGVPFTGLMYLFSSSACLQQVSLLNANACGMLKSRQKSPIPCNVRIMAIIETRIAYTYM